MDKPLLASLKGNARKNPPVWLMRQAGRYLPEYNEIRTKAGSFLDLCFNPELAAEVTLQPIRRFHFDAAILFSDILVLPHALGMKVEYLNGEGPKLDKITGRDSIQKLQRENISGKLAPVMEAIKIVKKELPKHTALIGFAGAPWTVAAYMLEGGGSKDFAAARGFAYREPEAFRMLLDILVQATSEYLIAQVSAGAEALQIFDSWAAMVPGGKFPAWVTEPTKRIIDNVKTVHPHIPFVGFPRGSGMHYRMFAQETGVEGVSIDSGIPLQWAARHLQIRTCVQGNFDPALLAEGNEKSIRDEVKRIRSVLEFGPHIFNLGHGILPHTPVKNVEILVDAVRG